MTALWIKISVQSHVDKDLSPEPVAHDRGESVEVRPNFEHLEKL